MARMVTIVCDITDEPDASAFTFGWEGKIRSIDITDDVKAYFEALVQPFVDASVEVGRMDKVSGTVINDRRPAARSTDGGRHTDEEIREIRQWAAGLNMKLPDGKIGIDVWTAFRSGDLSLLKPGRLPQEVIDREVEKRGGVPAAMRRAG